MREENNARLLELASLCEKASAEGERNLIRDAWVAVNGGDAPWHGMLLLLDNGGALSVAMTLVPEGLELAIYTPWVLTEGYPKEEGGWIRITDDMPRGCWVRTTGRSEAGGTKNIQGLARTNALAVTAIALRARASGGIS